jgi:crotonobetainyl-CoA:carnitine CoA-transferase CaiB-like acyl-CoA transferase
VSVRGAEGALDRLPGFDPVFQARSGFMTAQGGRDQPVFHMIAYNDYSAGTLAAFATTAALVARERRGRGQRVETSLMRTALVDQAAHMTDSFPGGRDHLGPAAARRLYACADGWICVAAGDDAAARALGGLGRVAVALGTAPDGPEAAGIAAALGERDRTSALASLARLGVPSAPCLGFTDLVTDEHVRANGMLVTMDDPALGPVTLGGPLVHLDATPIRYRRLGPGQGEHTREVLGELGYDAARVEALTTCGAVR